MMSANKFPLVMISAMNENGGNTLHRFFDGHPQAFVYPFESQLGTSLVSDYLSSLFPLKYRWPEFSLSGDFHNDYEIIIDEELKRHIKTPAASKFKEAKLVMDHKNRKKIFLELLKNKERTRANIIMAFFESTFKAWGNRNKSGKEQVYIGYSPIVGVDAQKIFKDFPGAKIVHIIRNPFAAYTDTKKRPVCYAAPRYGQTWSMVQLLALQFSTMYPKNFYIVCYEDLIKNPKKFFVTLVDKLGISYAKTLEYPSWNGKRLEKISPWGVVESSSVLKLSNQEYREIKGQTAIVNKILGYDDI